MEGGPKERGEKRSMEKRRVSVGEERKGKVIRDENADR